jgi:hypothetical protein
MKFSQAISRVKWLSGEKTNVSKTISALVLRVLVCYGWKKHSVQIYTWPSLFTRQRNSSYSVAGKATNLI